jgi:hypothetical protein
MFFNRKNFGTPDADIKGGGNALLSTLHKKKEAEFFRSPKYAMASES